MKKHFLISTGILVSGMLCAQVANKSKIPSNLANVSVFKTVKPDDRILNPVPFQVQAHGVTSGNNLRTNAITENVLCSTNLYDLQSNSSVGDRIVVNADGSISAVWTFEPTDGSGSYVNRGTGYSYYNGSSWSAAPTARIENVKVGWGNIVNTRSGKELVLAHFGGSKVLQLASRATKGTGTWAFSTTAIPSANAGGNFWPRMVTSSPTGGDTIYAISVTSNSAGGGTVYNGLDGAVLFHRSLNAGTTWDLVNQLPAGLTSSTFVGHGGDAYAIAAKGSTVVIVAGDNGKDLVMTKSTDAGATWTPKTVLKFPIALFNSATMTTDSNADGVADTLYTNDGNLAVGLDNSGTAYVAYGRMRVLCTTPGTGSGQGLSYFPYTDGLCLWNENMPQDAGGTIVAGIEDLFQQGTIYFPPATSPALPFGTFGCSLTSYPSLAFDASNNIYLSYSSIGDSLISVASTPKLVRNVYVIKSCDGGTNWTNPFNVVNNTPGAPYEGMFASMAKNVDGNVHLIYQRDFFPGYGVPPSTGTGADQTDNLGQPNDMVYVKIPVADLGNCPVPTGINSINSSVTNLNFYPNPASSNGTIEVVLNENAKMEVAVLNSVGQVIYSTSVNGNIGVNKVDVNLNNLSSGLYFYQVRIANNKAITKKFAVEK